MEQLGKAAVLSATPTSHSHHLTTTATTKKRAMICIMLRLVAQMALDPTQQESEQGKIMCYSFVFEHLLLKTTLLSLKSFHC